MSENVLEIIFLAFIDCTNGISDAPLGGTYRNALFRNIFATKFITFGTYSLYHIFGMTWHCTYMVFHSKASLDIKLFIFTNL